VRKCWMLFEIGSKALRRSIGKIIRLLFVFSRRTVADESRQILKLGE
jgi:hypothetical protein